MRELTPRSRSGRTPGVPGSRGGSCDPRHILLIQRWDAGRTDPFWHRGIYAGGRVGRDVSSKKEYQIQNGPCSYTFLLPEQDSCPEPAGTFQRDEPAEHNESVQRLEQLETIMENNTQWLIKLENYIQENVKHEMVQIHQTAVRNHTAAMIDIGSSLLSQTRKLTSVEAQRVEEMEEHRQVELKSLKEDRAQLQELVLRQTAIIKELEQQLTSASSNNSALQRQQHHLLETVNSLISTITVPTLKESAMVQDAPAAYTDCAAAFKAGKTQSGIYSLAPPNSTDHITAYCDMETLGGGWMVIQRRFNGEVDFHRTWKEYKMGFGDPAGEHWLGNEFVSQLTNQRPYVMRIQLQDWEGNKGFSQYDKFLLSGEAENYR
ncbi:hypothetical protein SKAU_G00164220 [Synaphobranchus kaupii]|uniref:Fibrinogen C-terminal domain-containing protein n=1 Tax=Synaphobranchus kaupii TaxID=118154 RepID=A0A9Q1J069_SYNKA|nr:hypothetical protein SKAU_G00164220 [Synaphobranchus kaupii]